MQQSVKLLIGEVEYEITKPLAEQGLEFSLRVGKLAVPFIAQLSVALSGEFNMPQLIDAARQLILHVTAEDLKYLNTTLGEMTQAHLPDGRVIILRRDQFQHHFSDRYDEWLTWVVFGVRTVCGSFFAGAMGLGALLKKQNPSGNPGAKGQTDSNTKSQSPVERTG